MDYHAAAFDYHAAFSGAVALAQRAGGGVQRTDKEAPGGARRIGRAGWCQLRMRAAWCRETGSSAAPQPFACLWRAPKKRHNQL
jgi:hypothetical protein